MFTLSSIKAAHAKVKSGADFPNYVKDIILLGVTSYATYVTDGRTVFFGEAGSTIESGAKYEPLIIANNSNKEKFMADLKAHQQGKTDYATFCNDCALSGIEKWLVDTSAMSCTYYDQSGNQIVSEQIPTV
jgi:uncharacterized protein YbcV (DUF1398 family)